MRTPHSPHEANAALEGLYVGNDITDTFPQDVGDEEALASSESDSEGDLVPGENNRAMPGTSSRKPDEPREEFEEVSLSMIHSKLLIPKPRGILKYNVDNGINTFISPESSLYQSGGPIIRVQESRSWNMDVMLCWKEHCSFCSQLFGPEESLEDRKDEADLEERRVFDTGDSPYRGLPFVHSKDIRIRKDLGGLVFSPLGTADADVVLSSADETREVDVLFTVSKRKMRIKCLACVVGRCTVCTEARAEAARQSSFVQEEQSSSPEPHQKRRQQLSAGEKLGASSRKQDLIDGGQGDADVEEQLFIDGDGGVLRGFLPRESPSGSSIEVAPRRSKGNGNVVDE